MGTTCCKPHVDFETSLNNFFEEMPLSKYPSSKAHEIIFDSGFIDHLSKQMYKKRDDLHAYGSESKASYVTINFNKVQTSKEDNYGKSLPQNNFQEIIYKHMSVASYEKESLNYFLEIYKMIPHHLRYPVMKVIIVLLAEKEQNTDKILCEVLSYYNQYRSIIEKNNETALKTGKLIKNEYLFELLKYYVKGITKTCLKPLMRSLLKDNYHILTRQQYEEYWKDFYIESYIYKNFAFHEKVIVGRSIEKFVKDYLDKLDPIVIRSDLTEYSRKIVYEKSESQEKMKLKGKKELRL